MKTKIKPLGGKVLVRLVEPVNNSVIIIPEVAKEKPTEGIVMVLGTGKLAKNGVKIPFEVRVGDKVVVNKYCGTEVEVDGELLKLVETDEIMAVIE